MKNWIAGHRALLGIGGLAGLIALFASLACPATPTWLELALLTAALLGLGSLIGSPYWKIVYKESPLRRAISGITDLDERELELRDRANGLAYFLFVTINIVLIGVGGVLIHLYRFTLEPHVLQAALLPYVALATSLPVILLEWFEPSGPAPAEMDEEEEE